MTRRASAGFTLIELVVTVAIVSLLATMAMPLTQLVLKRSREQELRANLREIRDALDHYNELWRFSCQAGAGAGGLPGQNQGLLPGQTPNGVTPGVNGAGFNGAGGNVNGGGGLFGNTAANPANGAAGSVSGAGLGGNGGISAANVTTIGGNGANGVNAPLPTPPKMECPTGSTGWPKDLQTLADGVKNITSPTPDARIYFLRRIPRDPMDPDATVAADLTWGKRSSTSPPDDPQEGEDVFDVYSLSKANDITGRPYREW